MVHSMRILGKFCDFAIGHPGIMAALCSASLFVIFGLATAYRDTGIPQILAILIVLFFVIIAVSADRSDS